MTKFKKEGVAVVGFGLGGHHEDYFCVGGSSHLSGYDSPENWKPDEGVDYSKAVVIDKREAVNADHSLAYQSPLLGVGLEIAVEKFETDLVCSIMFQEISRLNPMVAVCATIAEGVPKDEPGPFDRVNVPTYMAWWKSRGARIGIVDPKGRIVWENGEIQPRNLNIHEMAERIGVTLEKYYSWGDLFRIIKDGKTLRDGFNQWEAHRVLKELGAPECEVPA